MPYDGKAQARETSDSQPNNVLASENQSAEIRQRLAFAPNKRLD